MNTLAPLRRSAPNRTENLGRFSGGDATPTARVSRRKPGKPSRKPHVHCKQAGAIHCTCIYVTPDDREGEGLAIRARDSKNAHKIRRVVADAYERGRLDGIEAATKASVPRYVVSDVTTPVIAAFADRRDAIEFIARIQRLSPFSRFWFSDLVESAESAPAGAEVLRKLQTLATERKG